MSALALSPCRGFGEDATTSTAQRSTALLACPPASQSSLDMKSRAPQQPFARDDGEEKEAENQPMAAAGREKSSEAHVLIAQQAGKCSAVPVLLGAMGKWEMTESARDRGRRGSPAQRDDGRLVRSGCSVLVSPFRGGSST